MRAKRFKSALSIALIAAGAIAPRAFARLDAHPTPEACFWQAEAWEAAPNTLHTPPNPFDEAAPRQGGRFADVAEASITARKDGTLALLSYENIEETGLLLYVAEPGQPLLEALDAEQIAYLDGTARRGGYAPGYPMVRDFGTIKPLSERYRELLEEIARESPALFPFPIAFTDDPSQAHAFVMQADIDALGAASFPAGAERSYAGSIMGLPTLTRSILVLTSRRSDFLADRERAKYILIHELWHLYGIMHPGMEEGYEGSQPHDTVMLIQPQASYASFRFLALKTRGYGEVSQGALDVAMAYYMSPDPETFPAERLERVDAEAILRADAMVASAEVAYPLFATQCAEYSGTQGDERLNLNPGYIWTYLTATGGARFYFIDGAFREIRTQGGDDTVTLTAGSRPQMVDLGNGDDQAQAYSQTLGDKTLLAGEGSDTLLLRADAFPYGIVIEVEGRDVILSNGEGSVRLKNQIGTGEGFEYIRLVSGNTSSIIGEDRRGVEVSGFGEEDWQAFQEEVNCLLTPQILAQSYEQGQGR